MSRVSGYRGRRPRSHLRSFGDDITEVSASRERQYDQLLRVLNPSSVLTQLSGRWQGVSRVERGRRSLELQHRRLVTQMHYPGCKFRPPGVALWLRFIRYVPDLTIICDLSTGEPRIDTAPKISNAIVFQQQAKQFYCSLIRLTSHLKLRKSARIEQYQMLL